MTSQLPRKPRTTRRSILRRTASRSLLVLAGLVWLGADAMAEPVTINGVTYAEQPQEDKSFTERVGSGFRRLLPRGRLEPEPDENFQEITPTPAEPTPAQAKYGQPTPAMPQYGQPTPVSSRHAQPTPATPRHSRSQPAAPRYGQPTPASRTPAAPATAETFPAQRPVRYDLSPALKNSQSARTSPPARVTPVEMEITQGPILSPQAESGEPRRLDTRQPLMRVPAMHPSGEQPRRIPAQPVATEPRPLLLFDPNPLILDEEPQLPMEEMGPKEGENNNGENTDEKKEEEEKSEESRKNAASQSSSPQGMKPLHEIDPYWDYRGDAEKTDAERPTPEDKQLTADMFSPRAFAPETYTWEASNISYNPLYFEDVPLERYGHTYGQWLQPIVSVAKFSTQLVGLPYQMALHPPHEEVYPLGYYQPGECAPKKTYQIPWNTKAAAVQTGAMTGLFYVIP